MTLIILDTRLFNYINYKDYSTPNRSLYFRLINCIELPVSEREKNTLLRWAEHYIHIIFIKVPLHCHPQALRSEIGTPIEQCSFFNSFSFILERLLLNYRENRRKILIESCDAKNARFFIMTNFWATVNVASKLLWEYF